MVQLPLHALVAMCMVSKSMGADLCRKGVRQLGVMSTILAMTMATISK